MGLGRALGFGKTLKPASKRMDKKVIVVRLPGHDDDQTAPAAVSLNIYRDKVIAAMNMPVVK